MAQFTKFNNPNKRRNRRRIDRSTADILAAKNMLDDKNNGIELPLSFYDYNSDKMSGNEGRR